MENPDYYTIPQPHEITIREREDGMGAYLMMFAALAAGLPLPIINLIAALVYYYINRKKSRFVHFHALQSLLSQLPTTLLNWGALFWSLQIFLFHNYEIDDYYYAYMIFTLVMNIAYFIFSIVAAIRARNGEYYYFLLIGSYSYDTVYSRQNSITYKNEMPMDVPEFKSTNQPPF